MRPTVQPFPMLNLWLADDAHPIPAHACRGQIIHKHTQLDTKKRKMGTAVFAIVANACPHISTTSQHFVRARQAGRSYLGSAWTTLLCCPARDSFLQLVISNVSTRRHRGSRLCWRTWRTSSRRRRIVHRLYRAGNFNSSSPRCESQRRHTCTFGSLFCLFVLLFLLPVALSRCNRLEY